MRGEYRSLVFPVAINNCIFSWVGYDEDIECQWGNMHTEPILHFCVIEMNEKTINPGLDLSFPIINVCSHP